MNMEKDIRHLPAAHFAIPNKTDIKLRMLDLRGGGWAWGGQVDAMLRDWNGSDLIATTYPLFMAGSIFHTYIYLLHSTLYSHPHLLWCKIYFTRLTSQKGIVISYHRIYHQDFFQLKIYVIFIVFVINCRIDYELFEILVKHSL